MAAPRCRFCDAELSETFVDLGMSPLSNAFLTADRLEAMEPFYPLHAQVCGRCFLVQLQAFERPESIFGDYAYFSSYSDTWLAHCRAYVETVLERCPLPPGGRVVEIASNDGYLLQYFQQRGIEVLGIEPARNVAQAAVAKGIPTETVFFGTETARRLVERGLGASLLVGNNVLAHVPDLNDFVAGLKILLDPDGILTMEFPHVARLMEFNQFDTVYHEHFSYFSFRTAEQVFHRHGLTLFDVEELPTHGGSLRIWGCHAEAARPKEERVGRILAFEAERGLDGLEPYRAFGEQVKRAKRDILAFLIDARRQGRTVVGYGAPAKGNTLLNYCGIRTDLIDFTVDRSPEKQGKFLPGTHIPVYAPERIAQVKPDYVFILPWNLRDEITGQMGHVREWGGRFVVPIPTVEVIP
ncbi:MAG TPA: class I SAM-dependent methyltransferase [Phycisphaerae bacterium]|nr:class I SAM-dependent methyltransferase [Phycisphaerae bacterium]